MTAELTCANPKCRKPIGIAPTKEDNAPPHIRVAMVDNTGQPIKGSFRAYHVDCAPWWAEHHAQRTMELDL